MNAPDLVEPVVGFRAWRPRSDGTLGSWSMGGWSWQPGVNEATCPWRSDDDHLPPGHDCACGLYALTDAGDPRLDPYRNAVGSIAAWGVIEAHRTGFRAQFATVTALCRPPDADRVHVQHLRAAAERYGVPLVPEHELVRQALRHGRAIDFDSLRRERVAPARALPAVGARGVWIEEHVWLVVTAAGVRIGATGPLAEQIEIASAVRLAQRGEALCRGEVLARIGDGDRELVVRAPLDILVGAPNPALLADPDVLRVSSEDEGWLVDAFPTALAAQADLVVWGPRSDVLYRSSLVPAERGADPFCWNRSRWVEAQPPARSAADVLRFLAAERARPRFADEAAVHERIGGRLERVLADPDVRRRVCRAAVTVALRLHRPDAELTLDLRSAGVTYGDAGAADIVLYTDAESADDFLAGRLDIAGALRSKRVQTRSPPGRVLSVASVIKAIHAPYAAAAS